MPRLPLCRQAHFVGELALVVAGWKIFTSMNLGDVDLLSTPTLQDLLKFARANSLQSMVESAPFVEALFNTKQMQDEAYYELLETVTDKFAQHFSRSTEAKDCCCFHSRSEYAIAKLIQVVDT